MASPRKHSGSPFGNWIEVFGSKEARDAKCRNKDALIGPIITEFVTGRSPASFFTVLMPSLWGAEVFLLRDHNVPGENMFAIERDKRVHACIANDGLEHFKGVRTTPRPMPVEQAIDHVPFGRVDLVYLDFFGQPNYTQLTALYKLFRLRLLQNEALVLVTLGHNRGEPDACQVNSRLRTPVGRAYVEAALDRAAHRPYRRLRTHEYSSDGLRYTTTEVRF